MRRAPLLLLLLLARLAAQGDEAVALPADTFPTCLDWLVTRAAGKRGGWRLWGDWQQGHPSSCSAAAAMWHPSCGLLTCPILIMPT